MKSKPTFNELEQKILSLEKKLRSCTCSNSNGLTQQYLKAILDNTNLPICLKDKDYKYILVNREYEYLAQVTNEQILGKDDFTIFPEPVAQLFRDQDEEVTRQRMLVEFEETIPLPDGVHTFLTAKFPVIDSDGRIYAIGGVCTDITALKKTEAELRKAEEIYRGIFENSPLGILHVNKEGYFTASNQKLADILGSSVDRLVGFNALQSLKDKKKKEAFVSALSGKISFYEGDYRSVTGRKRAFIRCVYSPVFSKDGSVSGAIGIIEDISERKKAKDELLKAHEELEERVAIRTAELDQKTQRLQEANVALKVLLEKREGDKRELEERMMFNIEKLIFPYLEKLKMQCNSEEQKAFLKAIQTNLSDITSSFSHGHRESLAKLTPAQIQIADLIKQGLTTKEIASLLNLSPNTVSCHRQEIRRRLSLTNKKINLQAKLGSDTE